MENFVYEYPVKVLFGKCAAKEHLGKALGAYGTNVMLAYGGGSIRRNGIYSEMLEILNEAGKKVTEFHGITPNPTYAKVQEGAALARGEKIDFILAVGGGSVIDCCKVIAAQAVLEEDIWDMELVRHQFPSQPPIPMGAVVTASGTGAEMNCGAVITHEEKKVKTGLFAAAPRFAVLDPDYTMSVPFSQVMSGAFDTLSHAMETYFGRADRDNVSDDIAEAVIHPPLYRLMCRKAPEKFARLAVNVWAVSDQGKTEQELALAGVDALANFIRECGLPARLGELGMRMEPVQLFTSGTLKKIADSCSLVQTGQAQIDHAEIFELLKECL